MSSSFGIKTSFWGPHAWAFLFSSIAGAYPVKVDYTNKDHIERMKGFKKMITSLKYTLPCGFCRQSYSRFLRELPLCEYDNSRRSMMKWMYLLRDKVNQKLIKQELECYEIEIQKLKSKKINSEQMSASIKKLKKDILKTKPSPAFAKVLSKYEEQRAGCSKKSKRCLH